MNIKNSMRLRAVSLSAAMGAVLFFATSAFALFEHSVDLTVSGYTGSEALTNFPVLVRISETDISGFDYGDCAVDGMDISFTDASGNIVPREIDTWNTSGESLVWVSLPIATNGTSFTMNYGDASVTEQPACQTNGAVWSAAGYKGVWHMNTTSPLDASCSGNNGTDAGSVALTSGVVGSGLSYPNSSSYVSCGSSLPEAELTANGYTIEGWVNLANTTGNKALFGKSGFISYRMEGTGVKITTPGVQDYGNIKNFITTANKWHHFTLSFIPNTTGGAKHYLDGTLTATQDTTGINNTTGSIEMWLGRNQWGNSQSLVGRLDEYRLSATIRSADWIAASYASQTNAAFLAYGEAKLLMSDGEFRIIGSPAQIGSPSPGYGLHPNITQGSSLALSMPQTVVAGEGTITNYLAGWTLETVDVSTGARTLVRDSSSPDAGESLTLCNYTHNGYSELTWQWDVRGAFGLGGISLAENGGSYLDLDIDVLGLGYEPGASAELTVSYGLAADSLSLSQTSTISALGATTVRISRLMPGLSYYFKATLNDGKGATAQSSVFNFTTKTFLTGKRRVEYIESTGFQWIDTLYYPTPSTHAVVDWQFLDLTQQSRVFGLETGDFCYNAYINGSGNWGYCYADSSSGNWNAVGGNNQVVVDMERHYLDFNYIDGDGNHAFTIYGTNGQVTATQSPLETSGATKTATVPFAIGANRTGATSIKQNSIHRIYSMTLDEGGAFRRAWSPVVLDDGTVALYDSIYDTLYYSASSSAYTISGPPVSGLLVLSNGDPVMELSFLAAAHARSLCLAYGPTSGGDNPANWATTNFVAAIPAGATSYSVPLPANWGADGALVARCYFDDGTSFPLWSDTLVWQDTSAPVVGGVTVDGAGGDTLVVSGSLTSFTGDDCTLTIYTVATSEGVTNAWANLPGSVVTSTGDFSFTLYESNKSSVRYITPGSSLYVIVEATSGGKFSRTAPIPVKTWGAPVFFSSSSSVNFDTLTFSGSLSDVGARGSAVVTLYFGTQNNASALEAVETPVTVTDGSTFRITHKVSSFQTTYYWQFRAVATTAGEATALETRTSIASCNAKDDATYTWQAVDGNWDGDWSDATHWNPSKANNLGYPHTADAIASFENCTLDNPVVVTVTNKYDINYLRWQGSAASDVSFVGGGKATSELACKIYRYDNSNRVRSNSRVEFRDLTLTRKGYAEDWEILRQHPEVTNVTVRLSGVASTGSNYFSLCSPNCRLEFLNGCDISATKINVGGTNTVFVLDDSIVQVAVGATYGFIINADILSTSAGPVDIIIRGKSSKIVGKGFLIFYNHNPDYDMNVRLEVPIGGFAEPPIQISDSIGSTTTGKKGKICFFVEESSPALVKANATLENMVIAQQTSTSAITTANIMDGIGTVPMHNYGAGLVPCGAFSYGSSNKQILLRLKGWGNIRTSIILR